MLSHFRDTVGEEQIKKNKHKVQTSCDVLEASLFSQFFKVINTIFVFRLKRIIFSNFILNVQSGVVVRALAKSFKCVSARVRIHSVVPISLAQWI